MSSLNDLTAPSKEAKSFDAWFFKQSKKSQEKMREAGVLPYREMVQSRHIFNIDPNHPAWATVDGDNVRQETETFISRDHVGVMLKAFFDAIAYSDCHAFRRHVELVRWSLSLPGCLGSRTLCKMYGRSHMWAQKRAKQIRLTVNADAVGLFPHQSSPPTPLRRTKPCEPPHPP